MMPIRRNRHAHACSLAYMRSLCHSVTSFLLSLITIHTTIHTGVLEFTTLRPFFQPNFTKPTYQNMPGHTYQEYKYRPSTCHACKFTYSYAPTSGHLTNCAHSCILTVHVYHSYMHQGRLAYHLRPRLCSDFCAG